MSFQLQCFSVMNLLVMTRFTLVTLSVQACIKCNWTILDSDYGDSNLILYNKHDTYAPHTYNEVSL